MSTRSIPCTTAVLLVLVAAAASSSAQAVGCNSGGVCRVDVTVGSCTDAGLITASPDTLVVPQPRGAKKIDWQIVSPGYEFAANGIEIESKGAGEFDQPRRTGPKFTLRNKHSAPGEYKYTIRVRSTGGGAKDCTPKDPVINNK